MFLRQFTSIIVNSRIYFCLGWKSDKSLATQNKNDDLSDNDDNVRDNDNNFIVQKNIKQDIVNNNLNNIFQQLLRAKQHIARSRGKV